MLCDCCATSDISHFFGSQRRSHRSGRFSHTYIEKVRDGTILPSGGVSYYKVPAEHGVGGYRYSVMNNGPVLVEQGSRQVVEVID
ncbi:DUF1236 domain-containing protein [Methylorubrum sp. POS3]|uniref:DUF1236 domain-containing protein n=1 Tax=Methylorubrum sp. POS3 TaxID=2998492 RepID=UPI00372D3513